MHKRSLFVALISVLVPWILVAIPGTRAGSDSATDETHRACGIFYRHGWPFIHLDSSRVSLHLLSGSEPFSRSEVESAGANAGLLLNSVNDSFWSKKRPPLKLDWRWQRTWHPKEEYPELPAFWSDTERWPRLTYGSRNRIRVWGLICNLLVVFLVWMGVVSAVEYCIRRSLPLIQISCRRFLVAIIIFGFLFLAFPFIQGIKRDKRVFESLESLESLESTVQFESMDCELDFKLERRLPMVVCQLLNHGRLPLFDYWYLHKIRECEIWASNGRELQRDSKSVASLIAIMNRESVPVSLEAEWDGHTARFLESLGGAKITEMTFVFGAFQKETLCVDLSERFPELQYLTLDLGTTEITPESIQPFLGISSLQAAKFWNVDKEASLILIQTQDQWPARTKIQLRYGEDWTEDLLRKLGDRFEIFE